jgi:hypothetical protein
MMEIALTGKADLDIAPSFAQQRAILEMQRGLSPHRQIFEFYRRIQSNIHAALQRALCGSTQSSLATQELLNSIAFVIKACWVS